MTGLLGPDFLVNSGKFLAAIVFAFYLPGNCLVKKLSLPFWQKIGLSLLVGLVLWGYQGFIFGFLQLRYATYLYLLLALIVWLLLSRKNFRSGLKLLTSELKNLRLDVILVGVIGMGIIFHLSAVWFTAMPTDRGLWFCCRSVPDNIAHLVRTQNTLERMPPYEAGVDGIVLVNYHYWASIVAAETTRIFAVDLVGVTFRFLPLFLEILLAGALISFANALNLEKGFTRWLALFTFWSGDILYVLIWLTSHKINLETTVFDDATKLLAGPPRAFSFVVILWGIFLFVLWLKKRNLHLDLVLIVIFASLVGFKIYTAIFAFAGLFAVGSYFFLKRDWRRLILPVLTAVLAAIIYWPVNGGSNNALVFHPAWVFREFTLKPDLGLVFLAQRRDIFLNDSKNFKALFYDLLSAGAFFLFLFGTTNLALIQSRKSLLKFPVVLHLFLVSGIIFSLILGLFSSQTNGGANTIQLVIALYFFLGIYASLAIATFLDHKPRAFVLVLSLVIILFTVPRGIHEGIRNITADPSLETVLVPPEEQKVFALLKQQPKDGRMFLLSPNWAYQESWLYSRFLSGKPIFLGAYNGVQLDHNVLPAKERKKINDLIFSSASPILVSQLLINNNIEYLLYPGDQTPTVGTLSGHLVSLYASKTISLVKFSP